MSVGITIELIQSRWQGLTVVVALSLWANTAATNGAMKRMEERILMVYVLSSLA